jgi:branched-chain amino acid transport system ATP-binding protein
MNILEVSGLTKLFGQLAAVNNLSFEVAKGEIFGIAGPNGAGKSTVFNVLTGLYQGSGKVFFDNVNISGLRPNQICRKGMTRTFQIPEVFYSMTVLVNVMVGAHFGNLHGYNEDEVIKETINLVGLQGKENTAAENLNLYDKKLTMLAAALATKPKLLLLDEPCAGLSPTETRDFMNLVNKLNQEQGITIIIIEHHMKVLTELSQRLMIMHNGEKICIGSPEEVSNDERVIELYLGVKKHA